MATDLVHAELTIADLAVRGVEHVRVLVNGAADEWAAAARQAYPDAAVTDSFGLARSSCLALMPAQARGEVSGGISALWSAASYEAALSLLHRLEDGAWRGAPALVCLCKASLARSQAFFALPRRVRAAVLRADEVAARLQAGVAAALRRRRFDGPEAAASFAESWLGIAVHRLRSPGPRATRRPLAGAQLPATCPRVSE